MFEECKKITKIKHAELEKTGHFLMPVKKEPVRNRGLRYLSDAEN